MQWYKGSNNKEGGTTVWEHTPNGEVLIADCGWGDLPLAQMRLNAQIMAAAPDLIAALQHMLQQFADHAQYDEEDAAAVHAAQAAIAKALTGQ